MKFKDFLLNGLLSIITLTIFYLILLLQGIILSAALNSVLFILTWIILNQLDQFVTN